MNTTRLKSVKSSNPIKSVILTSYDIVKAHVGEISVESPPAGLSADKAGEAGVEGKETEFQITLPIN